MAQVLNAIERRVLGVLAEKGLTTPEQYPLTLNSVVLGCNQKSCREPVTNFTEENVLDAIESLRTKGLVTVARSVGSRTDRYKHRLADTLKVEGKEAAVLAELLLRGPQTDGELRQRASRMVPIPGLPELAAVIERLRARESPFIVRLGADGRRRGIKYAHTFYSERERPVEDDEPEDDAVEDPAPTRPPELVSRPTAVPPRALEPSYAAFSAAPPAAAGAPGDVDLLRREIARLAERVEELEATFARFLK